MSVDRMDVVCQLCSHTYGHHSLDDCMQCKTCPGFAADGDPTKALLLIAQQEQAEALVRIRASLEGIENAVADVTLRGEQNAILMRLAAAAEDHAVATEILALFTWELAVGVMRRDDDRPTDAERAAVKYLEARIQRATDLARRKEA